MARLKKATGEKVTVEALRDGVFVADDVRCDKGERATVSAELAKIMQEAGLVRLH